MVNAITCKEIAWEPRLQLFLLLAAACRLKASGQQSDEVCGYLLGCMARLRILQAHAHWVTHGRMRDEKW